MDDLNDLAYFAHVAEHGGFAAAERATGIPKSKLSRRIAELEARLGVRLIQRSTRRFAVTDIGQRTLQHARAMLAEAASVQALAGEQTAAPRGTVRLSCPPALLQHAVSPVYVVPRKYVEAAESQLDTVPSSPADVPTKPIDDISGVEAVQVPTAGAEQASEEREKAAIKKWYYSFRLSV